jgi:hypothetical protein
MRICPKRANYLPKEARERGKHIAYTTASGPRHDGSGLTSAFRQRSVSQLISEGTDNRRMDVHTTIPCRDPVRIGLTDFGQAVMIEQGNPLLKDDRIIWFPRQFARAIAQALMEIADTAPNG